MMAITMASSIGMPEFYREAPNPPDAPGLNFENWETTSLTRMPPPPIPTFEKTNLHFADN
jgi:hypothetical protein